MLAAMANISKADIAQSMSAPKKVDVVMGGRV